MMRRHDHSQHIAARSRRLLAGLLASSAALTSLPAGAQDWFLLQGIIDAEFYDSDSNSPLLTRNDGNPATLGRLQLWTAFQLSPSLQFYAQGQLVSDNFEGYGETDTNLEQAALRYTRQSAPGLLVEVGKILSPLAAYSDRRLSTQNPLIGQPYLYTTGYPYGAKVAGAFGRFDYQVAWIEPADSDTGYQLTARDSGYRPALGAGVTPLTGLRFGLTWTRGPYLNHQGEYHLPDDSRWQDYDQRVLGVDFQFSRGYLEFNGQWLRTSYEVPYHAPDPEDSTWYLELKYTWTPRLYGAVRFQGVEATYVRPSEYGHWRTQTSKFEFLEIGLGYRLSPELLFKAAYQADHWDDAAYGYGANARGHALGLQLSWAVDFASLLSEQP